MSIYKIIIPALLMFGIQNVKAQTDLEAITSTLLDYLEGTANGEPERVKSAFHDDLNLYSVANDTLQVWYGQDYVGGIKQGKKSNRIGRIVSIDYENDAAIGKIEIMMPGPKRIYTDYLMLLKYQGRWKIIHKSFTYVNYPSD
ncbi:nuclear transport factor 2 family protein [Aggregatimonas sangjinii]|uniref:Nuclear transport factor 2 family protein n=1 Tax=Aggregatimonas sangjinii TaxID=2583587 RepID=A0A5B7SZ17_9FLAO|nr:nuclear transport factor 2 family protein [Aggregatimonas sangjinii]QCX02181.1 nuclear transport factor 2 family protein [Aggregatimonas sangjinii]